MRLTERLQYVSDCMILAERRQAWWKNQPRDTLGRWSREQVGGGGSGMYPGGTESHEHPDAYQTQKHVNTIMGGEDHGFHAEENNQGDVMFRHEDDPGGGVPVGGSSMLDTIIAMGAYIDWASALAASGIKWMGGKMVKAIGDLNDALNMWTGG